MNPHFWRGRRVFVTGHTGFKGSWLCLWLQRLGAHVTGYALPPPTTPSLFETARVAEAMTSVLGDVRDLGGLTDAMRTHAPEIVVHMAAQPLVRLSYEDPVETYMTNVMGTVHLLEALRRVPGVRVAINVTSDKCYENREWIWGYRESDPMGGYDPYSNSKGCAELITDSYRRSFFNPAAYERHGVALASARAGNVIGGGDWARDRLVPDILRALGGDAPLLVRSPASVRPWQHVLEPLSGYLRLAEALWSEGRRYVGGWNFGPDETGSRAVAWVVERFCEQWNRTGRWANARGDRAPWRHTSTPQSHEAAMLKLDCSKARSLLGWTPRWQLAEAIDHIVEWHDAFLLNADMRALSLSQIALYESS